MPLTISEIKQSPLKYVSVDLGEDGSLSVGYDPKKRTPVFESSITLSEDTPTVAGIYSRWIVGVVKEWDLFLTVEDKENGQTVPITYENIMGLELPTDYLRRIVAAIQDDMVPNPTPSPRSGSFS